MFLSEHVNLFSHFWGNLNVVDTASRREILNGGFQVFLVIVLRDFFSFLFFFLDFEYQKHLHL